MFASDPVLGLENLSLSSEQAAKSKTIGAAAGVSSGSGSGSGSDASGSGGLDDDAFLQALVMAHIGGNGNSSKSSLDATTAALTLIQLLYGHFSPLVFNVPVGANVVVMRAFAGARTMRPRRARSSLTSGARSVSQSHST